MNIQRMHHEVKLRGNKINSNHYADLPSAYIDDFLNEAQRYIVTVLYSGDIQKRKQIGIESTQHYTDLLSNIVIHNESITPTLVSAGVYKIQLKNLSKDYRHYLSGYVQTSCGKMKIETITHNELESVLEDANRKPSSLWKRCIATFAGNSDAQPNTDLILYTDGVYTISSSNISYLRNPRNVFYSGYDSLEYLTGDLTAPQALTAPINSELNDVLLCPIVVDVALMLIDGSLENINKLQINEAKIQKLT